MSYENWKNKAQGFQTVDVRHIQGSFFEGLKKRAEALEVGEGLHIIQTFEPHPLYAVMEGLGYEHHTEQRSEAEFHVWFCRVEKKEGDSSAPFKPLALLNYPMIDEKLGQIAVDFWETTWQSEKRVLPYETRLLLSLTNAVGAGRMRQAARELVKAYIHGVESAALDDVFELLAWNQGIGFFSSEIGPSALFQAYKLIKNGTGSQRECLLAAFDSNKKIVLVKKDEAVVARACLRLTKGAFQKPPAVDFSFADLSQENMDIGKPVTSEKPVLFLESIYTFGLNDIEKEEVMKLAVSLTTQKAAELGVVAVLARRYLGCYERDEYVLAPFYVYISKSKNGWQYLDSLGGAAYTSAKEEYVEHPFLVIQTAMHHAGAHNRNEVDYE